MHSLYYLLVVFTALLSAISQILLNYSNTRKRKSLVGEYVNIFVITSYGLLMLTLVLNIYVLRFIPMIEAHVVAASTYVFVLILSRIFLKEKITWNKILGNIAIVLGIIIFVWQ